MAENIGKEWAERILRTALAEDRAAELIDCLFAGGSATVDYQTGKLMLVTGAQLHQMMPD